MIHFPDYVHAIHDDRRRSFEASAQRAAVASARTNPRKARWFASRRTSRARRSAASAGPASTT